MQVLRNAFRRNPRSERCLHPRPMPESSDSLRYRRSCRPGFRLRREMATSNWLWMEASLERLKSQALRFVRMNASCRFTSRGAHCKSIVEWNSQRLGFMLPQ